MTRSIMFAMLVLPSAALAECPPAPDVFAATEEILSEIRAADTELDARELNNRLWELWVQAPDEPAQALLDRGMRARASYDFLGAAEAFDRLIDYCPDYAEGYNQRAFVNFLTENFPAALDDLDEALERRPNHVAALSGKALTLMGLGRHDEAQEILREAVRLNPWIPERGLLIEPSGEDL